MRKMNKRSVNKKIKKVMSTIHWKARKRGMSFIQAFRYVQRKAIPLKIKNPYGNKDGDNKVNKYDCQPKNKKEQDEDTEEDDFNEDNEEMSQDDGETFKREREELEKNIRRKERQEEFLEENPEIVERYRNDPDRARKIREFVNEELAQEDMENDFVGFDRNQFGKQTSYFKNEDIIKRMKRSLKPNAKPEEKDLEESQNIINANEEQNWDGRWDKNKVKTIIPLKYPDGKPIYDGHFEPRIDFKETYFKGKVNYKQKEEEEESMKTKNRLANQMAEAKIKAMNRRELSKALDKVNINERIVKKLRDSKNEEDLKQFGEASKRLALERREMNKKKILTQSKNEKGYYETVW